MFVKGKNIQFWRNGKDLGVAFSGISFDGKRCCPLVGLSRRSAVLFNFGKEPFSYPVDGYNLLHSFLSDEELVTLTQLYLKYKGDFLYDSSCTEQIFVRYWKCRKE
jgi:hypothetical protein